MTFEVHSRKEARTCADCGNSFEATVWVRADGTELPSKYCNDCKKKKQELEAIDRAKKDLDEAKEKQRDAWYEKYGVNGKFLEKSFENFERERQPKAFDTVKGCKDKSLVLLSPGIYGLGKTHLICALANHLIDTEETAIFGYHSYHIIKRKCPVFFITEPKLLVRIRETFNRKYDDAETEEDIYCSLARFPLLIIDDVGKVRPRDYSFLQGVYFRIIDERYVNDQQIILSTNLDFKELEEHIGGASADRLREMCGKEGFIKMTGKSGRR